MCAVTACEMGDIPKVSAWRFVLFGCLCLVAAVWLVYAPVRHFDYVDFDDGVYVSANQHVLTGLSASNIRWALTWGQGGNWHPVTWWSLMLDSTVFGARPAVFHVVNVFFHAANACMLFFVVSSMTGARWRALISAALFALHPLRVESVAWITERKDVLAIFFLLLTMLAYIRYARTSRWRWLLAGGLLYSVSMMAKALTPTFPFLLLLLDYWPLGRWNNATRIGKVKLVLEKAVFAIPAACIGLWVVYVQWKAGTVAPVSDTSLPSRLVLMGVACFRYIAQTFWPVNLSFFYPYKPFAADRLVAFLPFAGVILLTVAAWMLRRRAPWFLAGWGWYLVTLLPVSGLLRLGGVAFADHYTYLPHMGVFIVIVWGVAALPIPVAAKRVAAAVVLVALAVASRAQVMHWRDSDALFARALAVDPSNELALTNIGARLAQEGKVREALAYFEKAIALGSKDVLLHFNAGNAYLELGELDRAEARYVAALGFDPLFLPAGRNLGIVFARQGRWDDAIYCLEAARKLDPADETTARLLEAVMRQAEAAARKGWPLQGE